MTFFSDSSNLPAQTDAGHLKTSVYHLADQLHPVSATTVERYQRERIQQRLDNELIVTDQGAVVGKIEY